MYEQQLNGETVAILKLSHNLEWTIKLRGIRFLVEANGDFVKEFDNMEKAVNYIML